MAKKGTNCRIVLIYGEPGNGKSHLAQELKTKHGYHVISTDELYVDFIREHVPDIFLPLLRQVIQQHYLYIASQAPNMREAWAEYLCRAIEEQLRDALYREWSPQRVDTLRMHAGLNQKEMAGKLHIPQEKLIAYLKGDCTLSHRQLSLLRDLAVDTKFERQEAGAIDWSDRRACFCLAMHCGWKAPDMARRLGVAYATVTAWWDKGVPKQSVRYWNQLNAIARQYKFDAGMLLDDYLWTREFVEESMARSGCSRAEWVRASNSSSSFFIRGALGFAARINRSMAYLLTKAALRLGAPLPPRGYIEPKRRPPRPFPYGCKGAQGARVWQAHELALLGTMPDRVVAQQLGSRTYVAVRHMRRALGLQGMPSRRWQGTPVPASLPLEEVLDRYRKHIHADQFPLATDQKL